ncbi:hypothetical protein DFH28DRAFT_981731 [Melampsora americana]|nr:hypothetical protein DFH28DRAFT_981731 [Melampsora americana]
MKKLKLIVKWFLRIYLLMSFLNVCFIKSIELIDHPEFKLGRPIGIDPKFSRMNEVQCKAIEGLRLMRIEDPQLDLMYEFNEADAEFNENEDHEFTISNPISPRSKDKSFYSSNTSSSFDQLFSKVSFTFTLLSIFYTFFFFL